MWYSKELCSNPKFDEEAITLLTTWTDWWQPQLRSHMTYFDSWVDLKYKLDTTDFAKIANSAIEFMEMEELDIAERWRKVLGIQSDSNEPVKEKRGSELFWSTTQYAC
jgi:hypothetical protein